MVSFSDYGNYRQRVLNDAMRNMQIAVQNFINKKNTYGEENEVPQSDVTTTAALMGMWTCTNAMQYWSTNGVPSQSINESVLAAVRHLVTDHPNPMVDFEEEWTAILEHTMVFADVHNGGVQLNQWVVSQIMAERVVTES